jgi:hypothetical protein
VSSHVVLIPAPINVSDQSATTPPLTAPPRTQGRKLKRAPPSRISIFAVVVRRVGQLTLGLWLAQTTHMAKPSTLNYSLAVSARNPRQQSTKTAPLVRRCTSRSTSVTNFINRTNIITVNRPKCPPANLRLRRSASKSSCRFVSPSIDSSPRWLL